METKFENKVKRIAVFLFPWRDVLGIYIASTPFRLGEIYSIFFMLIPLKKRKLIIKRDEVGIFIFLVLNFLITILGIIVFFDEINFSFSIKYLIRNACYTIMFLGFLSSSIVINDDTVKKLMRFFTVLLFILFIIQETTRIHFFIGKILFDLGQYVNFRGLFIPRFVGVCSEPGYLAPIIVMPIYFFLNTYLTKAGKEKRESIRYMICLVIVAIFTFSSAVYAFVAFVFLFCIFKNSSNKKAQKKVYVISLFIFVLLFCLWQSITVREFVIVNMFDKIKAFFYQNDSSSSWSANDRIQHLQNSWHFFTQSNILQILIGHGTGAYSKYASNSNVLVQDVEDAYNIYLSTLCDRGIIGLILIIALVFIVSKFRHKTICSETIYCGIVMQLLHWVITGNFWVYYFWYEIMFLMAYSRWYNEIN